MNTKYIHHIHLICLFLMPTPFHLYLPLEKAYFTLLSFIFSKVNFDSARGFHLGTPGLNVWCFSQISPPPSLLNSLSLCSPSIQQLTVQYVKFYSYADGCLNTFHSLTFSFPLSQTDTLILSCSFCHYTYDHICICTFNLQVLLPRMRENIQLFEPGSLHLT
jgi:hypothetical protein